MIPHTLEAIKFKNWVGKSDKKTALFFFPWNVNTQLARKKVKEKEKIKQASKPCGVSKIIHEIKFH